eukprot:1690375-Karenia_brevis.AAC.1
MTAIVIQSYYLKQAQAVQPWALCDRKRQPDSFSPELRDCLSSTQSEENDTESKQKKHPKFDEI